MKVSKDVRDVVSNNLSDIEKDRLQRLWLLPCYRLRLDEGLALRDAYLAKANPKTPEHLKEMLATSRWADSNLPILLFPARA